MADAYRGLTIEFSGDSTKLSKALSQINKETRTTGAALAQVERGLKFNPGNTTLVTQQQKYLRDSIGLTAQKLEQLKKTNESYANAVGPLSKDEIAGWEKVQREIVTTESTLKHYKQALTETIVQQGAAESLLGKVGSKIESFGTYTDRIGAGMQTIGRGMTATVTPAIIAAGAATIVAATTIDTSLTNVKKTVNGTEEQYQALKASAVEFSKTNAVSASQILDIQALGAQLGFAIDELDMFGQVVSGLDIATNMDAETAATQMAQFANITKLSHDQVSNYGSAIVGLGNNFATTESDISAMAMRLAAAGTQVGMNQADILGLATALSSLGVEAEAGGSAVSTVMSKIDVAVATNSSMLGEWAGAANMSAEDFSAAWKNSPVEALSAVLSGMEAATEEGSNMNVILGELGITELRQTDNLKRMAGNSDLVARAVAKSNEEWSKNTALQNEVDNRNQSLAAKFEMLKNRVIAVADQVGGPLAEALLDAIDAAEPLFEAIADGAQAFAEMDKDQQQLILTVVALAAAAGPLLNIIGGGITHIKGFGAGMQKAAEMLAKFDFATSGAARSTATQATASTAAAGATTGLATSTKAASVAMGGLKAAIAGTGIGLLVIALGMLVGLVMDFVDVNNKAADRTRKAGEANDALKKSLDSLDSGFESAKSKASDYSVTADDVRTKTEEMTQAHKDLADSLTDSMTEAGSNAGMLESYMGVIENLGTKSNLTGEEQAKLKDAVAQVNDACGTSFQVTNDQNGALYGQVDAIRAVISAQQDRIRYEAASEGWKEVLKQQEADLIEIQRLEQQKSDLLEKTKGETAGSPLPWTKNKDIEALNETIAALGTTRESYRSTCETAKQYEDRVGSLGAALGSSSAEIVDFANSNEAIVNAFSESGQSLDTFASELSKCGVSTSELSSLTEDQLAALVQSYDGSTQSIVAKLQEFGLAAKVEGVNASANLAAGISEGTQKAIQAASEVTGKTIDQISAECTNFGIEGDAAIAAYASALANGSSQATAAAEAATAAGAAAIADTVKSETPKVAQAMYLMKDGILQAYNPITGECSAVTYNAMAALKGGIDAGAPLAIGSAALLKDGVVYAVDPLTGEFRAVGDKTMAGIKSGIDSGTPQAISSAANLAGLVKGVVDPLKTDLPNAASEGSRGFGSGIGDGMSTAQANANSMAGTSLIMKLYIWTAKAWGSELSHNFADGIWAGRQAAVNAATAIANAVKNILGHTVPKEGPLRNGGKGEAEWGAHTVQNYVSGVRSQIPELKKAMREVSAATAMPFALAEKIRLGTPASAARAKLAAAQSVNTSSVSNDNRQSAVTINVSVHGGNERSVKAIAQEIYTLEQRAARGMRR